MLAPLVDGASSADVMAIAQSSTHPILAAHQTLCGAALLCPRRPLHSKLFADHNITNNHQHASTDLQLLHQQDPIQEKCVAVNFILFTNSNREKEEPIVLEGSAKVNLDSDICRRNNSEKCDKGDRGDGSYRGDEVTEVTGVAEVRDVTEVTRVTVVTGVTRVTGLMGVMGVGKSLADRQTGPPKVIQEVLADLTNLQ